MTDDPGSRLKLRQRKAQKYSLPPYLLISNDVETWLVPIARVISIRYKPEMMVVDKDSLSPRLVDNSLLEIEAESGDGTKKFSMRGSPTKRLMDDLGIEIT